MFDGGPPIDLRCCRVVCRMNMDHTIGDVRNFINAYVSHLSHCHFTNDYGLLS